MKNNNGLYTEGAYQWALSESQNYGINDENVIIDFKGMVHGFKERNDHDSKISVFESEINKNAFPVLMIERVECKKETIAFYTLNRKWFDKEKQESDLIQVFLMNGRIRYQEELNKNKATFPIIVISA